MTNYRESAGESVRIGEYEYRVVGRLAETSRFRTSAGWTTGIYPTLVVVKEALSTEGGSNLERTYRDRVGMLEGEVPGREVFRHLLPALVGRGVSERTGRYAEVYRYVSGFSETFETVRTAYPEGVDPRHAVWAWKRGLDLLAYVHSTGRAHSNLSPAHLLVHPRDHSVRFAGWSRVGKIGTNGFGDEDARPYDEGETRNESRDLRALARSVGYLLGGDDLSGIPKSVPEDFRALVFREAKTEKTSALALHREVSNLARALYGEPRFVPLRMPGWNI